MDRTVSVIIPVYNCQNFLKRAVESVINQKMFNDCEIVLVDDGSTDNSPAICDFYAEKYDNVKVIHQPNSGVSVARNKGIEVSEGEWICFLDSDDYLLPDAINLVEEYPDADIICSAHDSNIPITDINLSFSDFGFFDVDSIRDLLTKTLVSRQYFYSCWAKLFRRSIITNNNISFPIGRKIAEDMVFVYTYLTVCRTIAFSEKTSYYYFVNDANTTNVVKASYETLKFIYEWKKEYFVNNHWYTDNVKGALMDSFIWNSFLSFKSEATYSTFFRSVRFLNKIFNDNYFRNLYLIIDYKTFKTFTDKMLDRSIRNKNSVPFCIIAKLNLFKSKFFSIISRWHND